MPNTEIAFLIASHAAWRNFSLLEKIAYQAMSGK